MKTSGSIMKKSFGGTLFFPRCRKAIVDYEQLQGLVLPSSNMFVNDGNGNVAATGNLQETFASRSQDHAFPQHFS